MSKKIIYEIRVKGVLDARWCALFAPLTLMPQECETLMRGPIQDQPELFGILLKIRDLGLPLISVKANDGPRGDH